MPFIDEKIEEAIVKEFARICGVKPEEVSVNVQDRLDKQAITLKASTQTKDATQETELTIEMVERNKFNFIGKVTVTGKATWTRDIAQTYTGSPQTLTIAMRKVLAVAKIRKGGLLSKYFGIS